MPSLKRNVSNAPESTGFESYDGPELPHTNRMYRGRIEYARVREASTGTLGYNILVKLEAEKGSSDSKYDGYPAWCDLWLADKEPNQAREAAFYRAVGVPEATLKANDVNVVHDDLDDGGALKKISGKKVIGSLVKVDMRTDRYGDELRMRGDAIFPAKKDSAKSDPDEDLPEPDEPEDDLLDDEEYDEEARREELEGMNLRDLRNLAKSDYDLATKGLSKDDLVEAVLEAGAEFLAEPEEDEPEPEDEPDDEASEAYQKAKALSLPKLRAWAKENGGYKADDLKGLSKDDILEMLVEDEILEEPPF